MAISHWQLVRDAPTIETPIAKPKKMVFGWFSDYKKRGLIKKQLLAGFWLLFLSRWPNCKERFQFESRMDDMDEVDNLDKKTALTPLRRYNPHKYWRKQLLAPSC